MRIIPAIDIINGRCVRLSKGDYSTEKVYAEDPLQVAREFEEMGIKYLHLVDLDGAKEKAVTNWKVVENICRNTDLKVDFGGGIRSNEEIDRLFGLGVEQINIGSLAANDPERFISWLDSYGAERFILSVDLKDGKVATHGWMNTSEMTASQFIFNFVIHGLKYVVSTDISRDGMMSGPNFELYKSLVSNFSQLKIIASGGISSEKDILDLVPVGVDGVITGKAIYEGAIDLKRVLNDVN